MAHVTIMVGIPGSGKTTYAQEHFYNTTLVSSDEIRKELYGDISIQGDPKKVFNIVYKRIEDEIKKGNDVVFDATNTTFYRRNLVSKFRIMGAESVNAVYMNTPFYICLERNKNRTDRSEPVPREIMEKMFANMLRTEHNLIAADGFDTVLIVKG